jgi:hypothetical protein
MNILLALGDGGRVWVSTFVKWQDFGRDFHRLARLCSCRPERAFPFRQTAHIASTEFGARKGFMSRQSVPASTGGDCSGLGPFTDIFSQVSTSQEMGRVADSETRPILAFLPLCHRRDPQGLTARAMRQGERRGNPLTEFLQVFLSAQGIMSAVAKGNGVYLGSSPLWSPSA